MLSREMPSSSNSSGFSCRGVISSWLKASVATSAPFVFRTRASIALFHSTLPASPIKLTRGNLASSREEGRGRMPFKVPPLPYDYAALQPYIDEQTMHLHHDKHHQAYVDKANGALEGTEYADSSVEQILTILDELPDDIRTVVRNNAGGHANHSFFWEIMGPDGGGEPEGPLADAIDDVFGSLDELKKAVNDGGINRFGSGWTWLVYDGTNLAVYSTPNQDSPIIQSDEPILGIDVWEHSYYLKYQNRRPEYLEAWWNVVNWPAVAERYAQATRKEHAAAS